MKPYETEINTTLYNTRASRRPGEDFRRFRVGKAFLVHWHEPAVQPAVQNHHAPRMFHCQD